jgi:hypothetical protein
MSDLNVVQSALPDGGVPASGLFDAVDNLVANTFNTSSGNTDSPFNGVYIGDSSNNIVGTAATPYLPMALPAYIPTLYENVYHVQTNLKNEIPLEPVANNREYPTIYAVKQYVASQLAGTELLEPLADERKNVSTGVTSSFLTASNVNNSPNVATLVDADTGVTTHITTYSINVIDPARTGAEKVCINTSTLGQTGPTDRYYVQIYLTQPNQYFVVNGKNYKCYAFASLGDTLGMYQFLRTSNGNELFFVLNYGGLFSETPYYPLPSNFA